MDRRLTEEKIESLRRSVKRVEEKCPASMQALAADRDLQDIIVLNLTSAVQLCVDIGAHLVADTDAQPPDTMGDTFDILAGLGMLAPELAARLKQAVGFRNVAIHRYRSLDWDIVYNICTRHRDDFRVFAGAAAAQLG